MKQDFYGWKLVASLCLILMLSMGFGGYGGSVLNTQMMIDLHMDRKSLGLAIGSFPLAMGLLSPLAGVVVHRWGAKIALYVGTLTMALGAVAMATIVDSLVSILLVYGVIMGGGAAMGTGIPASTVVSYWFKKRLAMALTIVGLGANLGGFFAAPLLAKVISATDGNWKLGWIVVSIFCAISFFCALFFVRNKPSDIGQFQDGGEKVESNSFAKNKTFSLSNIYKTPIEWEFEKVIRHPAIWWMFIGGVCSGATLSIAVGHGVAHFLDLGFKPEIAATFLGAIVGTGVIGRVLYAVLGDYIEPRFVWSVSLFLMAIGMFVVTDATSLIKLYASATLLGIGSATPTLCMAAMAVNYFGQTAFSRFMGLAGLFMQLVCAIIVVGTGMAYDRMGSYSLVFYTSMVAFILVGLVMPFVRPPAYVAPKDKLATG